MSESSVRIEREGAVTTLTLDRPNSGNSLSRQSVEELHEAVESCYRDATAVLAFCSAGRNFCTGFDLSDLEQETDDSLLARFVKIELLLQSIRTAPFLTVAFGQGWAVGAGADLFAACRRRVVVGDARFRFPGAAFGLVLGTGRLARVAGAERACRWVNSGQVISAQEAMDYSLATDHLGIDQVDGFLSTLVAASRHIPDPGVRAGIFDAASSEGICTARDLELLVRSAARRGLCGRIQAYVRAAKQPPADG